MMIPLMKPKDLKCPFTWEMRRPLLDGRVLFVPQYFDRHAEWIFPGWEDPSLFGNKRGVSIEYCAGNGAWILEKALRNPLQNWVAVEKKFERVRKIWSKIQNHRLENLLVVCGEALTFTTFYIPANSVDEIYVNFPDPWPKQKHAKNRLLQSPFVQEIARIVKKEGTATLVTDDPTYSEQMAKVMLQTPAWKGVFPPPFYITDWLDYGHSYFDALWREKGRTIRYLQFKRL